MVPFLDVRVEVFSLLSYILFIFAALPVEMHLGTVFIRPIYLVGALALVFFLLSPRWRLPRVHVSYYAMALVLAWYLSINGFVNHNLMASVKEMVEVVITLGVFWFFANALQAAGVEPFLRAGGRVFFFGGLLYAMVHFAEGNFFSFKDSYWVILFSSIFATIEAQRARTLEARLRLVVSIILLVMSGSRTGWVAYFFFSTVFWGVSFRLLLLIGLSVGALAAIASYNEQTRFYVSTVQLLVYSVSDLALDDVNGWLVLASSFENPSDKFRLTEVVRAIVIFQANPAFGVGIDQYMSYATNQVTVDFNNGTWVIGPHNELLRMLCEGGLFYLAIIAAFYIIAVRHALRVPPALKRICLALVAASIGMFLFTATNFMITLLLQLSLCLSAGYLRGRRELSCSSSPSSNG